jgi:hypothetical protein
MPSLPRKSGNARSRLSEIGASSNKLSSMPHSNGGAARRLRWLAAGMAVMFLLADDRCRRRFQAQE